MIKMDQEKDKKSIQDIKMKYIYTSNLEKIGDLTENLIETDEGTKKKERCGQEKKTDGPVWKHFP